MDEKRAAFSLVWWGPTKEDGHDLAMSREQHAFFDTLYQQYYARVLAYCRFRAGRRDVAEDLASLVFERALTHIADLHTPEAAAAWLFRIAQNCAHDYFRRQRPEISLEELAIADGPQERSSEEQVLADEERRSLLAHVSHLSEREQEIIALKFVAHLTNRQIARVLHMPEGTVGSLLYRTLGKLSDALHEEGGTA
jgi:RNA polymerase sigma-70 factor (ECF subfamily)